MKLSYHIISFEFTIRQPLPPPWPKLFLVNQTYCLVRVLKDAILRTCFKSLATTIAPSDMTKPSLKVLLYQLEDYKGICLEYNRCEVEELQGPTTLPFFPTDTKVDCLAMPCNNGICTNTPDGGYKCNCFSGFGGRHCGKGTLLFQALLD